jgi:hypothetical protein
MRCTSPEGSSHTGPRSPSGIDTAADRTAASLCTVGPLSTAVSLTVRAAIGPVVCFQERPCSVTMDDEFSACDREGHIIHSHNVLAGAAP